MSPDYIRDETIEMVNLVLNQKDHDLVLVCLELLQILPAGIYHQNMLDTILEIDYKNNKEINLMLKTSEIVFEKLGYNVSDKQAKYMLDIVSGQIKLNHDDSEIEANKIREYAYNILNIIMESNHGLSSLVKERFYLEKLIQNFPKLIN